MQWSVRYVLSAAVGLGVIAPVVIVGGSSPGILVAIPFIYGVTAALVLDNLTKIRTMHEDDSRKLGMIGGGISAGSVTGLLQQSVGAGIVGFGLFVFGMALVIADPVIVADPGGQ